MTPPVTTYDSWIGRDAYDPDSEKIGEISDIYYDDVTGRPEWVAIQTGLFGTKKTMVPIHGSHPYGEGDLQVTFDKGTVKDAPRIDPDGHLTPEEERELWSYYGYQYESTETEDYGYGKAYAEDRADRDFWGQDRETDEAMTRSEEELRVGTQRQATGTVRLRKYVVTEQQQMTVPVQHEEVRVEREPITDANIDEATRGDDISEAEHEVTTYEERPVVTKQTVPKERVRLEKETVTGTETVEGDVRKEQIEVEGDHKVEGDKKARRP
jgi:uncharacterized protein (TIGR02271 family)